jgi:hypothetical protein
MWFRIWGFSGGDGAYYGWRWWLHIGPVLLLIGRASEEAMDAVMQEPPRG